MCNIDKLDDELRKINQEEFNIVSWCGVGTTETKHSSMIADLLNPRGPHGCREIPLKLFLEKIGITDVKDFYSTTVTTEKSISNGNRRLDIYLENDDFAVIIENKTESSDHYNQLKDYYDWLQDKNKNSKKMLRLAYLTYNDSDKANQPIENLCHLSYVTDIIPWLETIGQSYIPEDTKIAIKHYRIFLEKLLELPYVNKRKEIVIWASQHQNIARAKEIVMQNPSAFLLDTVQCVSEGICKFYCTELLNPFDIRPEQISVSEVSLDGSSKTPFRCVCTFNNGISLEFLPLAPNGRNYGKLYALNKDRRIIYSDGHDKKWSCNFFAWLYGDKDNETPSEWIPKNDISLANCIAVCRIDELMKDWANYIHQDQWKRNGKDAIFVEDGPFPYYWNQKTKILFIGRELYGKRNEGDPQAIKYWNERESMEKLGVFQSRLLYLAYGILHGECSEDTWKKMDTASKLNSIFAEDANKIDGAFSYAFMNASKILNEYSSQVGKDYDAFVNDPVNRAFFVREIELLDPDIIVSGNLNDLKFWEFEEFKARLEQCNDWNCHKENCFVWKYKIGNKKILLLDAHHFSARGKKTCEHFYEPICTIAKAFFDKDICL